MEPERQETYERIPWETLERKSGDRQWLVYAVAGAIALGALAYSFMRNQPTAGPPPEAVATTTAPATVTTMSNMGSAPSTVASPVVVAEADLYAVDPERLIDQAASHAEWVAVEYMAVDGSEQSREVLASLLPDGVPLPDAPEGTQVFVDWVGARSVTQIGPGSFDVAVLVRSLLSTDNEGFQRQPPLLVRMPIEVGEDGVPRVTGVPSVGPPEANGPAADLSLSEPPQEALVGVEGEVAGGIQRPDGSWDIVVVSEGPDGVRRPTTVSR